MMDFGYGGHPNSLGIQKPVLEEKEYKSTVCSFMSDSATPWTVACQTPLFMGFSRQKYWSGMPLPSLGDLPDPGIGPGLLHCKQILYQLSYLK